MDISSAGTESMKVSLEHLYDRKQGSAQRMMGLSKGNKNTFTSGYNEITGTRLALPQKAMIKVDKIYEATVFRWYKTVISEKKETHAVSPTVNPALHLRTIPQLCHSEWES